MAGQSNTQLQKHVTTTGSPVFEEPTTSSHTPTTIIVSETVANPTGPPQHSQSQVEPINRVLLVNTDIEDTFIVCPEKKEKVFLLQQPLKSDKTSTLHLLRSGLNSFVKQQKEHTEDHLLQIFCCKLPKLKKYYFYKMVKVIDQQPQGDDKQSDGQSRTHESEEHRDYLMFSLINRYVKCFATLAEFTFEFSVSAPPPNGGLSNVLVVDKVWTYNKENKLYIPSYKPIDDDLYTDYVITSLKDFYGCSMIMFVSTLHTALFANYNALQSTTKSPVPISRSSQETTVAPPPLKKRKKATTESDEKNLAKLSNPTLIVFKHKFVKREPLLVCPISIEIHLCSEVTYN